MEKIDFRKILNNSGNSEDVTFCLKFAEEHQAKGDITDVEIMTGILNILAMRSNHARVDKIVGLNRAAAGSIETLTDMHCWPQLNSISEHALKSCIEAAEADGRTIFKDYIKSQKVRLAALNTSTVDFEKVFTKEFLDKFA
jgi:hypothetical protein